MHTEVRRIIEVSLVDEEKIVSELKRNTLGVYWTLLNSEKDLIGVRKLQRQLDFGAQHTMPDRYVHIY